MGMSFRKSFKIAPGVKFNINKKSVGMTFGTKGAHYTINSKGTRTKSVGIPGTGLSYADVKNPERRSSAPQGEGQGPTRTGNGHGRGFGCLSFILIILAIASIVNLFTGHFSAVFVSLLVLSAILAIVSLFNPKLAFWTKKKTKPRAFMGYAILSIIFFIALGLTSASPANQPSSSSADTQTAATTDSSSSTVQADSSPGTVSNDITDSSATSSTASSSTATKPAATTTVTAKPKASKTDSASHSVTSPKPSASTSTAKPAVKQASPKPVASKPAPSLAVTGDGLDVSPGNEASVTIKTAPGAEGTIEVLYNSGPSKAKGLVPQTADSNGNITWTWKVGTRTAPGDYDVDITAGGKSITKTLHVQ